MATVIDLTSRRVVGWAIADHLKTDLVDAALRRRRPAEGLGFIPIVAVNTPAPNTPASPNNTVRLSVGRRGQCWDNAVAE
ncbi:hypothetical protein [Actinoplanes sp. TFC3]|uniref:hypothetical protein n=1 Tax=Actinoplanes sp. TFC3 TaxID=1710355 RepID=UPI000830967B|nr:hypothetical protein [Actinoplanes sp. TFC3]